MKLSNQAMEPTASHRTTKIFDDFNPFTRCHARSRAQQPILFALGGVRAAIYDAIH